jgi:predicted RNA-binding Zn-ribbon protein involved in translation (DUF1610 family)
MKIKCPKCGSANIRLAPTTPKALSQCFECGNIWRQIYKPRKKANAENCKNLQKSVIPFAIHSAIIDALDHAKTKHPHFANTDAEAGTVIAEELLEVNTAALKVMQGINDQADRDNLFVELAQLNATTIRMMEKLLK